MESRPDASPTVQFRCPCCRKLYAAEARDLLGPEPSFSCVQCGAEFQMRAEDLGLRAFSPEIEECAEVRPPTTAPLAEAGAVAQLSPLTVERVRIMQDELELKPGAHFPLKDESQAAWTICPGCSRRSPAHFTDCRSCGVVFAKWRNENGFEREVEVGATVELAREWTTILGKWEDQAQHSTFLFACAERAALPYAARKYGQILEVNPDDQIAALMRQRIVLLASAKAEPRGRAEPSAARFERPRRAASGFFSQIGGQIGAPELTSIAIALSTAVLAIGIFAPGLRQLTSLGASGLALTIGLRIWLRGPRL